MGTQRNKDYKEVISMTDNSPKMFSLENKVAIITGASRGLGKAIALAYSAAGAKVVVSATKMNLLEETADEVMKNGGEALPIKCDVGKEEEIIDLVKLSRDHYGSIDILVNNAGISPYVKWAVDVTKDMWEKVFQINLLAPFLLSREVGKIMIEKKYGKIINMSSAGGIVAIAGQIAYASLKSALIQMTKCLALEWAEYNITVNALAPSILSTDLTAGVIGSDQHAQQFLKRVPMKYFGEAEDAVGAAVYLASDAARYVTGITLPIDGGMLAS